MVARRAGGVVGCWPHPGLLHWEYAATTASGHEQPPAHVLRVLRVDLPDRLYLRPQGIRQAIDATLVDLDQVAGRVADVELHDVARKLDQVIAKRRAIERPAAVSRPEGGLQVVHGDGEVLMARRLDVALEQMELTAVPERQPLDGHAEVGVGDRRRVEQLDVELGRLPQVVRAHAHMVDVRTHAASFRAVSPRAPSASTAARSWAALNWSRRRSVSDMAGSNTDTTPGAPMTLGRDRVTPYV